MEGISPEVAAEIRARVAELAALEYPKVWVGEVGMDAEELLRLQELNDEGPDWMRVEPEDVGAKPSTDWIAGPVALALIPDHFEEGALGDLQDEVGTIRAAEQGAVMVRRAYTIGYALGDEVDALSDDDRVSLRAAWFEHDGRPAAMFYAGSTYRMVPLEDLTAADVDEELLEVLAFYSGGETWGPYVVEDTPRSRALVEARQGN